MIPSNINVFDFDDLENFITAILEHKTFTYKIWAQQSGIPASTISDIVSCRIKNCSPDKIKQIADGIGFNDIERRYFSILREIKIACNTSTITSLKKELNSMRPLQRELTNSDLFIFQEFSYLIIKEVACFPNSDGSIQFIYESLLKKIPIPTIKKSIRILQEKGYLTFQKKGKPFLSNQSMLIQASPSNSQLNKFNEDAFHCSIDIFKNHHSELPKGSSRAESFVFGTNEIMVKKLIQNIRILMDNLEIDVCQETEKEDRLYMLNLQLHPLTNI